MVFRADQLGLMMRVFAMWSSRPVFMAQRDSPDDDAAEMDIICDPVSPICQWIVVQCASDG